MAVNVSLPRTLICLFYFLVQLLILVIPSVISDTLYHLHLVFEFEIDSLGCMNN